MKILVIDDEPLIHISIEKLIQACSKEDEVLHAYNGHEMLKMLEEHEIAMAYVDIKMPGPSGLFPLPCAANPFASPPQLRPFSAPAAHHTA